MSDDVLKIFEGLTESQVKDLRQRIIEILPELRREVIGDKNCKCEARDNHPN